MSQSTTALLELRHYYQNRVAQAEYQSAQAKVQIDHINALLVNGLLQNQEAPVLNAAPVSDVSTLAAVSSATSAAPEPTHTIATPTLQATTKTTKSRVSLPFRNNYQGLKKLDAIRQVMAERTGQVLHQDTIIQLLFGDLNPADLKAERLRMKTILLQGVRKRLWQKAPKRPSSYLLKRSAAAAPTPSVKSGKGRKPYTRKVSVASTPVSKTRRSQPPKSAVPSDATVLTKTTSARKKTGARRGRVQVLSLPKRYEGLSKIDAVTKLLTENSGKVMHIEEIIKALYGKLAGAEHQAERIRMKDVMTRGVRRNLWRKAQGVTSSIVIGDVKPVATTPPAKPSTRKTKAPSVKKTSSSKTRQRSSSKR